MGEVGVFSVLLSMSRAISQAAIEDVKRVTSGTGGNQVDGCWLVDGADTCTAMQTDRDSWRTAGVWVQYGDQVTTARLQPSEIFIVKCFIIRRCKTLHHS